MKSLSLAISSSGAWRPGHVDAPEILHDGLHFKRIDTAELEAEGQGTIEGEFP